MKKSALKARSFGKQLPLYLRIRAVTLFILCLFVLVLTQSCATTAVPTMGTGAESAQAEAQAVKVPKNVIYMIGDGMGLTQVTAGMLANNNYLHLERCQTVGLAKTSSSDKLITDSAAGATALASGIKSYNGAIGVDPEKNPVPTLLEIAAKNNFATGLVATSSITHATPACFFAHQPSRNMYEEIAQDLVNSDAVDFFFGGGRDYFVKRQDGRNLLEELKSKGFSIFDSLAAVENNTAGKVGVFIADKEPTSYSEGRGDFLPQAIDKSLGLLSQTGKGFFLMVEGSQIDWAGHGNNSDGLIAEMIDFDNAIGKVLDFAEKDGETLVIITADHETGGYAITGGNKELGSIEGKFNTKGHSGAMVPVFAYGPGAEKFTGIYENTAIFHKIMESWKQKLTTP